MKRIAFFSYDLTVGGIQKSLVNLLNHLDYDKYDVDLYLFAKDNFWAAQFPPRLHVKYLKPMPRVCSVLPFGFNRAFFNPAPKDCGAYDLAIDFNSYQQACALGAASVPAPYRASWIHNDVAIKLRNEWKYRLLWKAFRGKFRCFNEYVGVSKALIEPFRTCSGAENAHYSVISNFIDVDEIRRKALEEPKDLHPDPGCLNFVAVGHLNHQKAYDIMLDRFAEALKQRDDLRLYILGDGPLRPELEKQHASLGLEGKVFFLGYVSNPYACMQRMDAFLSTSRYEGQPLNIMEAKAIGLPLYCTKNLEKYTEGLQGYEDITDALVHAKKEEKHPDSLEDYNRSICEAFDRLVDRAGEPQAQR